MLYSKEVIEKKIGEESIIDIDWYCIDENGNIAIIASGGGLLPNSVANDITNLENMINYFRNLPSITNEIILQQAVLESLKLKTVGQKDSYLKDLNFMVSKGLYYYDKKELNNYSNFEYFLKAKPGLALNVSQIDVNIRKMVERTILKKSFTLTNTLNVDQIA